MYRGIHLGALPPSVASSLPVNVSPIFAPTAPPPTDSVPEAIVGSLVAIAPAVVLGALAGAHLATYDERQQRWGYYGAFLGGGIAAASIALSLFRRKS